MVPEQSSGGILLSLSLFLSSSPSFPPSPYLSLLLLAPSISLSLSLSPPPSLSLSHTLFPHSLFYPSFLSTPPIPLLPPTPPWFCRMNFRLLPGLSSFNTGNISSLVIKCLTRLNEPMSLKYTQGQKTELRCIRNWKQSKKIFFSVEDPVLHPDLSLN